MLPLPTAYPSLPLPIFPFLCLAGSLRSSPFSKRLNTLKRRSPSQITPGVSLLIYSILYSLHISLQLSQHSSDFLAGYHIIYLSLSNKTYHFLPIETNHRKRNFSEFIDPCCEMYKNIRSRYILCIIFGMFFIIK